MFRFEEKYSDLRLGLSANVKQVNEKENLIHQIRYSFASEVG